MTTPPRTSEYFLDRQLARRRGREYSDRVTSSVDRVKLRETRLLDAAARLFARFGFDKTSVDEIATAAGVSKGAVYLHWPSKFNLFEAVLVREGLALLDEIVERLESDPEGGTLGSIYRHSILALGANPLLLAVYTGDTGVLGDYIRHQEPRTYAQRLLFGQEFVRRMQAANLIRRELNPEMTAYVMGVISFGLLSIGQLVPALRVPPLAALADALADLVERGLGTGNRHAAAAGKQAFRIVVAETRNLYQERTVPTNGHGG
jgi:AcrR family transcriptional regulator